MNDELLSTDYNPQITQIIEGDYNPQITRIMVGITRIDLV